ARAIFSASCVVRHLLFAQRTFRSLTDIEWRRTLHAPTQPRRSKNWEGAMHAPCVTNRLIVAALVAAVAGVASAAEKAAPASKPHAAAAAKAPTDAQLIASAMRAAPAKVGKDATIVAMEA